MIPGIPELLILLGLGGAVMYLGNCRRRGSRGTAVKLVALAGIIGGAYFLTHRSESRHEVVVARHDQAVAVSERIHEQVKRDVQRGLRDLDEIPNVDLHFDSGFPFEDGGFDHSTHVNETKTIHFGGIALGAVLLICGWLLFNRERSRPVAHKVLTTVGLLATGAILFSFLRSDHQTRHVPSRDVVVKLAPEDVGHVLTPTSTKEDTSASNIRRARRPVPRDVDELPPRRARCRDSELAAEHRQRRGRADKAERDKAERDKAKRDEDSSNEATASDDAKADAAKNDNAKNDSDDGPDATEEDDSTKAPAVDVEVEEAKPAEPKVELPQPPAAAAAESARASARARRNRGSTRALAEATEKPPAKEVAAAEVAAVEVAAVEVSDTSPKWANEPGKLVNGVYRVSIQSGLYADVPECQPALDDQIKTTLDDYIDRWMGEGTAKLVAIDREYVNEHVKKSEYSEVVNSESVGPMHQIHALLEIDDADRAEFHERWRRAVVTERVWMAGFAGAVVLALLSTVFGYLKLDLQTGGTHSGRLQLAATLVALIVAAGALLARWAVPF